MPHSRDGCNNFIRAVVSNPKDADEAVGDQLWAGPQSNRDSGPADNANMATPTVSKLTFSLSNLPVNAVR